MFQSLYMTQLRSQYFDLQSAFVPHTFLLNLITMNPVLTLLIPVFFQISQFVTIDLPKPSRSFLTNIPFIIMFHALSSDTLIKPYIGVCVHTLLLTEYLHNIP